MQETNAYITVTLDLKDPVDIEDFAKFFAGFGAQFDDFLAEEHPDLKGKSRMFVREVRRGSVVADLFSNIPDIIGMMDNILVVGGFAALFNKRIRAFIHGQFVDDLKKSNLKNISDTISAIANDKDGKAEIETFYFRENIWEREIATTFTSREARKAQEIIEDQRQSLDTSEHIDFQRVLMTFERSSISNAKVGKNSGE
jgi:hypothetical protein